MVNRVTLLGNVGADPVVRFTQSGKAVANFNLATSEKWTDKDGKKQESTEWHRVVVWDRLAELCQQYVYKGKQLYIEGRLQTREWDDKDGQKKYTTEIVATVVKFLGGAKEPEQATPSGKPVAADTSGDDLPF